MKVRDLPNLTEFFEANKTAWKEYNIQLVFYPTLSLAIWFLEPILNIRIQSWVPVVGGLWGHYVPEWFFFLYLGAFMGRVRKTLIPTVLLVPAVSFCLAAFSTLPLFGPSLFSFLAMLLFVSPFPVGYAVVRVIRRSTRVEPA